MAASGLRSSCEASATNWRTFVSLAWRAASASSTLLSMWLSASPTRPTSEVGIGVRPADADGEGDLAAVQRQLGHLLSGGGDPVQGTQAAFDQARARRPDADGEQGQHASSAIRLARAASTSASRTHDQVSR